MHSKQIFLSTINNFLDIASLLFLVLNTFGDRIKHFTHIHYKKNCKLKIRANVLYKILWKILLKLILILITKLLFKILFMPEALKMQYKDALWVTSTTHNQISVAFLLIFVFISIFYYRQKNIFCLLFLHLFCWWTIGRFYL